MSLLLTVEKLHPGGEMNATKGILLEDYPLPKGVDVNTKDKITYATKRIKELELLIHHWEKNEKQKQVPKACALP